MKTVEIKGIIPPLLTPMNSDESVNVAELRNQVNRMIDGGAHALFCFGTNGEGYILNGEEKKLVLTTVIDECNGRVPVYAGTGCISTRETIEQSKMAMQAGANVISLITPSFALASQHELIAHYEAVAKAVDLPIVLYNIPARTGNTLQPATVEKLAQIENIVGAKDSSGNFSNILAYIEAGKKKQNGSFATLSGNDQLIIWALMRAAKAALPAVPTCTPTPWLRFTTCLCRAKLKRQRPPTQAFKASATALSTATPTPLSKRPPHCLVTPSATAAHRLIIFRKRALPL